MSLLSRIVLLNAAVFVAAAVALAITPVTVSSPITLREMVVLIAGLTAVLVINLALLRRAFLPLRRLTELMKTVESLRPGRRISFDREDREVVELTSAFNGMLERLERERRDSVRRSLAAQEGERHRVARELHDEIGQSLTAVLFQLDRIFRSAPDELRHDVAEAREATRGTLDEVREVARRLRPEALDDLGLANALTALCTRVGDHGGLRVTCRVDAALPQLSPEAELVLYRVAQEALTNTLRHAGASAAVLELRRDDGCVRLAVRDDGRGLDGAVPGAGVQGMRERALLVEGELTMGDRDGGGVEVRLDLPVDQEERE